MANFPTPPTYTLPLEEDKTTKQVVFSPIWLRWFIDMANTFTKMGFTLGGALDHEKLEGLLGGITDEHYHLTELSHRYLSDQLTDGIVLRDTGGVNYWRIQIDTSGALVTTILGPTPP